MFNSNLKLEIYKLLMTSQKVGIKLENKNVNINEETNNIQYSQNENENLIKEFITNDKKQLSNFNEHSLKFDGNNSNLISKNLNPNEIPSLNNSNNKLKSNNSSSLKISINNQMYSNESKKSLKEAIEKILNFNDNNSQKFSSQEIIENDEKELLKSYEIYNNQKYVKVFNDLKYKNSKIPLNAPAFIKYSKYNNEETVKSRLFKFKI